MAFVVVVVVVVDAMAEIEFRETGGDGSGTSRRELCRGVMQGLGTVVAALDVQFHEAFS